MQGPTAVGTTCLRASWPVLGQVGAGIRSRKLHPILVYPWGSWGSQSLIQHASLAYGRECRAFKQPAVKRPWEAQHNTTG